jgi:peptidoglycan/LPS O-acetylase OafA/YrhL
MEKKETVYLKGLNGLRAIAALLILIGHTTSFIKMEGRDLPELIIGFDGVTLFFVISGFLITFLLLKEKHKTNDVHVGKFYLRRILRIWPIYYLFLLIGLIISLIDAKYVGSFTDNSIYFYLFFAANIPFIFQQAIPLIAHYWSIGVEEQFYLMWPWFMKINKTGLITKIVVFIIAFFVIKSLLWRFMGNDYWLYDFMSVTRFHCMLLGALGAVLYYQKTKWFISFCSNALVQWITWILAACIAVGILKLPAPLTSEVTAILSLIIIIGQVQTDHKVIFNLEKEWFDFLGKISYGIYLIHPFVILMFIYLYSNINLETELFTALLYVSVLVTTILVSYISYQYYEKPFLKLKTSFTVVKSSASKHESQ